MRSAGCMVRIPRWDRPEQSAGAKGVLMAVMTAPLARVRPTPHMRAPRIQAGHDRSEKHPPRHRAVGARADRLAIFRRRAADGEAAAGPAATAAAGAESGGDARAGPGRA